ncbi:MAG TPA: phosphate ABC transporter substrate-binding protein PstS [Acidimicrobiales bacterium]|nr:phosphate ABC transporter substrate-binding protein PstS [Acidimicrobiales bacterium]
MRRLVLLAAVGAVALAACGSSSPTSSSTSTTSASSNTSNSVTPNIGNPTAAVTINESGSSLLYPFLQELVTPLHTQYSNITLAPAPGGSGKGISDAIAGTVQLGGSDAYLSPGQLTQNPGLMNVPIVVSAQAVNYNVPGVSNLKLTGDILAKIYSGKIVSWSDPAIAAVNSGTRLPSTKIVPVRRVDSSGDTFIFTSFLSATNTTWQNGPGFGTTVTWPAVPGELTANGNPGMVQTCKATPGCVAYVGVSAESSAQSVGLGEAMLQNKAGGFVQPTADTITAAATAGSANVPDNLAQPLIYEDGAQSYPIVNFEYIVVKSTQSSADLAKAIRTFLSFAIDPSGGSSQSYLSKEDFVALPSTVVPKVKVAIAKITP